MGAREPTDDERAGMAWWNAMAEAERAQALVAAHDAGYPVQGDPSRPLRYWRGVRDWTY